MSQPPYYHPALVGDYRQPYRPSEGLQTYRSQSYQPYDDGAHFRSGSSFSTTDSPKVAGWPTHHATPELPNSHRSPSAQLLPSSFSSPRLPSHVSLPPPYYRRPRDPVEEAYHDAEIIARRCGLPTDPAYDREMGYLSKDASWTELRSLRNGQTAPSPSQHPKAPRASPPQITTTHDSRSSFKSLNQDNHSFSKSSPKSQASHRHDHSPPADQRTQPQASMTSLRSGAPSRTSPKKASPAPSKRPTSASPTRPKAPSAMATSPKAASSRTEAPASKVASKPKAEARKAAPHPSKPAAKPRTTAAPAPPAVAAAAASAAAAAPLAAVSGLSHSRGMEDPPQIEVQGLGDEDHAHAHPHSHHASGHDLASDHARGLPAIDEDTVVSSPAQHAAEDEATFEA